MGNMFGGGSSPDIPMYQEMEDTPWITQLRDIADKGGQGVLNNYNKVNVFSEPTRQEMNAQVNNVYNRAETDFDRNYRDTMQKLAKRNYSQFGTLNATPAAYRTDLQNLSEQRKLADLSYNKALYADQVKNNELQRRYNTLNMFNNMPKPIMGEGNPLCEIGTFTIPSSGGSSGEITVPFKIKRLYSKLF